MSMRASALLRAPASSCRQLVGAHACRKLAQPVRLWASRPATICSHTGPLGVYRTAPAGRRASASATVCAVPEGGGGTQSQEFGYSRKDIILIGFGIIGLGYALYYGLQAGGVSPGMAGNWVQLIIFLAISVGWVGSYIYRVATKQMTYVKQLEQYEDAVMRKRIDEMTDGELESMLTEAEATNAAAQLQAAARQQKEQERKM